MPNTPRELNLTPYKTLTDRNLTTSTYTLKHGTIRDNKQISSALMHHMNVCTLYVYTCTY